MYTKKEIKQALELKKYFDEAIKEMIERKSEYLLNKYPAEYRDGEDCDYVHNGVGMMKVRSEVVYNDDKLYEDSKECVAEEFGDLLSNAGKDTKVADLLDCIARYVGK